MRTLPVRLERRPDSLWARTRQMSVRQLGIKESGR
jgi:hypothetical protein